MLNIRGEATPSNGAPAPASATASLADDVRPSLKKPKVSPAVNDISIDDEAELPQPPELASQGGANAS